jgi:hypothetical protein
VVGKKGTPKSRESAVTNLPRRSPSNAKTLEFKHLHFPDMVASDGPIDRACVVHYWTDDLLIEHESVRCWRDNSSCLGDDTTLPFSQHLSFSSDRHETTRSPQIPGCIATID